MRKKTIFLFALLGLLGSTALVAQPAKNAFGFINVSCPQGFTLIACPLFITPSNDPSYAIDNTLGQYNGCQILFWQNGTWTSYIGNNNPTPPTNAIRGWVEPDGPKLLLPGAGAAFYNPNSASATFTFIGAVPTGSLTNTLNPGLNLVSSIVPAIGDLSADSHLTFPSPVGGQFDGDQIFMYFNTGNGNAGYTTYTVDSLNYNPPGNYGWDGLPGQSDPVSTNVAQAFWYRAGNGVVQWTENLVVNAGGVSAATRSPDAVGSAIISKSRHFQFTLTGPAGKSHVVEASSDLKNWQPVGTNLWASGQFVYTDPFPATNKMRFYRSFALP